MRFRGRETSFLPRRFVLPIGDSNASLSASSIYPALSSASTSRSEPDEPSESRYSGDPHPPPFPELFVIDQQSKIVGVVRHSEHDRLESLVRTLLARSEPPRPDQVPFTVIP
jgi:hypothetical protein